MRVRDNRTDEKRDIPLSGVFVAIGQSPETSQLTGVVDMDDAGYIVTDSGMRTSVPGVFAAGDIVKKQLRQVVTAAADGAVAVSSAHAYLHEAK
jgi:thioredoxin reductase (NADPH)